MSLEKFSQQNIEQPKEEKEDEEQNIEQPEGEKEDEAGKLDKWVQKEIDMDLSKAEMKFLATYQAAAMTVGMGLGVAAGFAAEKCQRGSGGWVGFVAVPALMVGAGIESQKSGLKLIEKKTRASRKMGKLQSQKRKGSRGLIINN